MKTREERLMPNDVPKYIRCYNTGVETYIIVFTRMGRTGTNRYAHKGKGYPYLSVSKTNSNFYRCVECEHTSIPIDKDYGYSQSFCVDFPDLPTIVRQEIRSMYMKLWRI